MIVCVWVGGGGNLVSVYKFVSVLMMRGGVVKTVCDHTHNINLSLASEEVRHACLDYANYLCNNVERGRNA